MLKYFSIDLIVSAEFRNLFSQKIILNLIGYSFYANNVGVDIDPNIIPKGNEYYIQVENALKSDDISEKINILLLAQLKSFTNVQDILLIKAERQYISPDLIHGII